MPDRFNHELLQVARQYRGLNQRDLASSIGLDPGALSRIENGLINPSEELIALFSKTLNFPQSYFAMSDRVYGLPVSVHPMYRKKASVSQKDLDKISAEMNIRIMHLRRMLQAVEHVPELPLPKLDVEEYQDIEEIAQLVRRTWLIPAGPLSDLTSYVERAGCFVIQTDLSFAAVDGVTLSVTGMPPCIFLNRNLTSDRLRFTLAHELGHIIMHRVPTPKMEDEANAFAGALLMPAKDIGNYFTMTKIDLKRLAVLKLEWKMAMAALLYRAKELGYLSDTQNRYLWQQFSINKIRLKEPPELDFEPEMPTVMPKVINAHLQNLGYSLGELSSLLKMSEAEISDLYDLDKKNPNSSPTKPKLRLVT